MNLWVAVIFLLIALAFSIGGFVLTYKSCDVTTGCAQDRTKSISGAVLFGIGLLAVVVAFIAARSSD